MYIYTKGLAMEYSEMDKEDVLDCLYAERARALDKECTWNVRNEAWENLNLLLDRFNELVMLEVEL